jgi:hypothetical protein
MAQHEPLGKKRSLYQIEVRNRRFVKSVLHFRDDKLVKFKAKPFENELLSATVPGPVRPVS